MPEFLTRRAATDYAHAKYGVTPRMMRRILFDVHHLPYSKIAGRIVIDPADIDAYFTPRRREAQRGHLAVPQAAGNPGPAVFWVPRTPRTPQASLRAPRPWRNRPPQIPVAIPRPVRQRKESAMRHWPRRKRKPVPVSAGSADEERLRVLRCAGKRRRLRLQLVRVGKCGGPRNGIAGGRHFSAKEKECKGMLAVTFRHCK